MTSGEKEPEAVRKIALTTAATLVSSLVALGSGDPVQVAEALEALAVLAKNTPGLPMRGDWPW